MLREEVLLTRPYKPEESDAGISADGCRDPNSDFICTVVLRKPQALIDGAQVRANGEGGNE